MDRVLSNLSYLVPEYPDSSLSWRIQQILFSIYLYSNIRKSAHVYPNSNFRHQKNQFILQNVFHKSDLEFKIFGGFFSKFTCLHLIQSFGIIRFRHHHHLGVGINKWILCHLFVETPFRYRQFQWYLLLNMIKRLRFIITDTWTYHPGDFFMMHKTAYICNLVSTMLFVMNLKCSVMLRKFVIYILFILQKGGSSGTRLLFISYICVTAQRRLVR